MFLESGRAIAARIQLLVDEEVQQPVRLAVAFWGAGADFNIRGECRIICDLGSGLCNPAVIKALLARDNVVVLQLPGLHAKVVVSSTGAVVSSANMSTNGLGAEGADSSGTIEAGYFVPAGSPDHEQIADWFEEQWTKATLISPEDLTVAALRWASRKPEPSALASPYVPDVTSISLIDSSTLLEPKLSARYRLAAVRPDIFNVLKVALPDLDNRRLGKIATWACHLLLNRAGLTQQHGPGDGEPAGPADDVWIRRRFGTKKRLETLANVTALLTTISRSTSFSRDVRRAAAEALCSLRVDIAPPT